MAGSDPGTIKRKIAQAQLAIGFERVWSALHWPLLILAAAAAAVMAGLLPLLPQWPRLVVLTLAVLVFLWSLRPLLRTSWPTRYEAMRRVEERTGLAHRPVSEHADILTEGSGSLQQAIWEEHKLRQLRTLTNLQAGMPRSFWRDIDPRALRLPAVLALVAAFVLGPGDPRSNLSDTLSFVPKAEAVPLTLDAWLKAPAYTGKPPVLLTSPAMMERLKSDPVILVPEKATLSVRLANGGAPKLAFHELADDGSTTPEVTGFSPKIKSAEGLFQVEVVMARPAIVTLSDGGRDIASWRIALIPDAPPTVEITDTPSGDSSGMLSLPWKAADDYGVKSIASDLYLADEQDHGFGFDSNGIFRFDPPKLPVALRKASPKEEDGTAKADMSEHPWAGFQIEATLSATDAAGNTAESTARTFRLPERVFTKLLARALIEQRRNLILEPEKSGHVVQMLDALLTYPDGLVDGSGTHIAIAMVKSRLSNAYSPAEVDEAIPMLWQIAVGIEEGRYADAKAELEALRKELERALRDGASPERIAELTEKLRKALDRYMQSLMEESQKRMQQGNLDQNQMQQGQAISPQDLQKMLDMIEQLAQSGANDAAQELLSQLENILRNLQPGMAQQQRGQQGNSPLGQMLDQLSDLMRKQQQLMDDTQRMQDGENGGQQQGLSDLGDRQRGLGEMLQQFMEQMGQNGMDAPKSFGQAGESMKGAEGSLRQGDRDGALGDQGDALAKLREGAQGLAQQLMQQGQGQQGNQGRHGEARGDDRDPLGRPLPNRGEDYGPERNMLPSELAIQRAREILEQLRSRAGETELPRIERDYIERLLRGLY